MSLSILPEIPSTHCKMKQTHFQFCAAFMDFPSYVEMEALMIHGILWFNLSFVYQFLQFSIFRNDVPQDIKAVFDESHKTSNCQTCNKSSKFMLAVLSLRFSFLFRMCFMSEIDVLKYSSSINFTRKGKTQVRRILGHNTYAHHSLLLTQASYKFIQLSYSQISLKRRLIISMI